MNKSTRRKFKKVSPEQAEALWQAGVAIRYSTKCIPKTTVAKTAASKQGPIWVAWAKIVSFESPVLEVEAE